MGEQIAAGKAWGEERDYPPRPENFEQPAKGGAKSPNRSASATKQYDENYEGKMVNFRFVPSDI